MENSLLVIFYEISILYREIFKQLLKTIKNDWNRFKLNAQHKNMYMHQKIVTLFSSLSLLPLSLSLFLRVLVTQHTPSDTKGRGPGGHKTLESTSPPAASAASGGEGKARLNNKNIILKILCSFIILYLYCR